MKISIIIPAYNADKFIKSTLNKLTNQTFKDFEIIIINDGSIDDTQKVVDNFKKNSFLNIKLINQENKGEGEARNTGLQHATGEYILFLDADDYLANDALEKLYNTLNENNADMSFSSYSYVFSNGNQKLYFHPNKIYSQEEIMKLFFRRLANPGIGNTLIKKSIIDKNNIKFEKYKAGADNHFFRKLLLHVQKVASIEDNLFFYQYNETSVMNNTYSFNRLDSIYSVIDTINEYEKSDITEDIIKYLDVFLINEVKANAVDFYMNEEDIDKLKNKILCYLPKQLSIKYFLSTKRIFWLFSLYVFYKFPILTLRLYKWIKELNK